VPPVYVVRLAHQVNKDYKDQEVPLVSLGQRVGKVNQALKEIKG
jgi:hypothetical protein